MEISHYHTDVCVFYSVIPVIVTISHYCNFTIFYCNFLDLMLNGQYNLLTYYAMLVNIMVTSSFYKLNTLIIVLYTKY